MSSIADSFDYDFADYLNKHHANRHMTVDELRKLEALFREHKAPGQAPKVDTNADPRGIYPVPDGSANYFKSKLKPW